MTEHNYCPADGAELETETVADGLGERAVCPDCGDHYNTTPVDAVLWSCPPDYRPAVARLHRWLLTAGGGEPSFRAILAVCAGAILAIELGRLSGSVFVAAVPAAVGGYLFLAMPDVDDRTDRDRDPADSIPVNAVLAVLVGGYSVGALAGWSIQPLSEHAHTVLATGREALAVLAADPVGVTATVALSVTAFWISYPLLLPVHEYAHVLAFRVQGIPARVEYRYGGLWPWPTGAATIPYPYETIPRGTIGRALVAFAPLPITGAAYLLATHTPLFGWLNGPVAWVVGSFLLGAGAAGLPSSGDIGCLAGGRRDDMIDRNRALQKHHAPAEGVLV